MHHQQVMAFMVAMLGMLVVVFLFVALWAARYARGGPNQVLIVSGRTVRLPDGSVRGYRIVKGGGTFVVPIIEKLDVLSLEVVTLELNRAKVRGAGGGALSVDGVVQFKINGDDLSIAAAAEQLLGKDEQEIKSIVQTVLEKHLGTIAGASGAEQLNQDPAGYAGRVQAAASPDLNKMGMGIVTFTLREIRSA